MSVHQLIIMSDGVPVPSELALTLKHLKAVWGQSNKDKAMREIAYIYWMYHVDSPYKKAYSEEERIKVVKKEVYGDENVKIPAQAKHAEEQYLDFYYKHNLSIKILDAAEKAIRELITYFDNVDMTKINKKGDLMYNPKDVIANMKNLAQAQDAMKLLRDKAMKELEAQGNKLRGNAEKTKYNT